MTSVRAVPCTEEFQPFSCPPARLAAPSCTPTLMEPTWAGGLHHSGNEPGSLELVKIGNTEGLGEVLLSLCTFLTSIIIIIMCLSGRKGTDQLPLSKKIPASFRPLNSELLKRSFLQHSFSQPAWLQGWQVGLHVARGIPQLRLFPGSKQ